MIFQTMNSVRTNNPSLKHLRFTLLVCKGIGIGKFEFVAKTQFLFNKVLFGFITNAFVISVSK